jgi:hypothetical protein
MTTKHTSLDDKAQSTTRMSKSVAIGITLAAATAFSGCAPQPQAECFTYQKREVCSESIRDSTQYRRAGGGGYIHGGHIFYYGGGGQRVYVPRSELPAVGRVHQDANTRGITTRSRGSTAGRPYSGSTVRGGFGGTGRSYGGGFA